MRRKNGPQIDDQKINGLRTLKAKTLYLGLGCPYFGPGFDDRHFALEWPCGPGVFFVSFRAGGRVGRAGAAGASLFCQGKEHAGTEQTIFIALGAHGASP